MSAPRLTLEQAARILAACGMPANVIYASSPDFATTQTP